MVIPQVASRPPANRTTKRRAMPPKTQALAHLQAAGLRLVERNYRTPGRGGGEIDLIMRAPDGTLVFVEVRQRASSDHGGAAASVSASQAAAHRVCGAALPAAAGGSCRPAASMWCCWSGAGLEWLQAAFDARA